LETCLNSACGQHKFLLEWVLIVQARILIRTGRPADALTLLAGWLERAKETGRGRNWLSICLISALAYNALNDREKAFHLLGDGLVFAQAQGHRRALIEEGEALRDLLETFRVQFPQSPFTAFITEILALFPDPFSGKPGTSVKVEGLYEALSPRELEILRLVCLGLSNQEIARQLVLSVGTVKFHIHHIFGKLGVRDRPQAIAKAVQLGI
jgi:LuxR family maltose regulon positive regulatory protein